MRVAVIGAGALGLYFGGRLQEAGHEVQFLLRRDYDILTRKGLRVFSPKGDFALTSIMAVRDVRQMSPVDLVLVGLKTTANQYYEELLSPLMQKGTMVLTLQNGLGNEEMLSKLFGAENVLGGVAYICANRDMDGNVHHLATGYIEIGESRGGVSPRCQELASYFEQAKVPCSVVADIRKVRWEKLVWNIPFNGLCALTGKATDELVADQEMSVQIKAMMEEIIGGGNAQQLSTPISDLFAIQMFEITRNSIGDYRPSMLVDRLNGKPLELDSLFRSPIAAAASKGVRMPRVELMVSLLAFSEGTSCVSPVVNA